MGGVIECAIKKIKKVLIFLSNLLYISFFSPIFATTLFYSHYTNYYYEEKIYLYRLWLHS